jgi:hypothetical protein
VIDEVFGDLECHRGLSKFGVGDDRIRTVGYRPM